MVILFIAGFYLGFLSLVHWLKKIFHNRSISIILDGISTILIVVISIPIMIVLRYVWLFLLKYFPESRYKYSHFIITGILFLIGIKLKFEGKFCLDAKIAIFNHSSPLDYLLIPYFMPMLPYNIVAGINLKNNKKTLEDKVVSWFIGDIIKDCLIPVDREDDISKMKAYKTMLRELGKGKIVGLSPEEGRISKKLVNKGSVLKPEEEFSESAFRASFKYGYKIQVVMLDWPVIWFGKDDERFGIHPTTIRISYTTVLSQKDFKSKEDMREYCYDLMEQKLSSSKNVQRFLKELQK
ncbi:MAG: hypothetical protein U0469_02745 [Candidatus Paceibacterota bacterium]